MRERAPSGPRSGPWWRKPRGGSNFEIKPDPRPEQGSFYRSDHFSLAKAGIPAFSIDLGEEFAGKAAGYGAEALRRVQRASSYHQPSDEFHEDWDFSGLEQIARFGLLIGSTAANRSGCPPGMPATSFFAREKKAA